MISRRNAACRYVNSTMKDDPNVVNIVPFHPLATLKNLSDGTILWYVFVHLIVFVIIFTFSNLSHMINKIYPNTVDPQVIAAVKRVLHPSGVCVI